MRRTCLADADGRQNADRPKRWRRLRRKLAVPAGVVAAALLFFLCAGSAQAVSAQKACKWRHVTNWADSLDDGESYTIGSVSCRGVAVSAACHVTIVMGPHFDFGDNTRLQACNAKAGVPVRRSAVLNYASDFTFALQLTARGQRWTQAFVGGDRPTDGCHYEMVARRHTLMCTNVHPS